MAVMAEQLGDLAEVAALGQYLAGKAVTQPVRTRYRDAGAPGRAAWHCDDRPAAGRGIGAEVPQEHLAAG